MRVTLGGIRVDAEPVRDLFCGEPAGANHCHLTKEGNAVVAEILHRHLRSLFPEGRRAIEKR